MPRTAPADPTRRTTQLTAGVAAGGESFTFKLCSRPLDLGLARPVRYYWMDTSDFRRPVRSRRGLTNYWRCVGLWWAGLKEAGQPRGEAARREYLLAAGHAVTAADKSLQRVYRDAHLGGGRTRPEDDGLPDDVRAAVAALDPADAGQVRRAFDDALSLLSPDIPVPPAVRMMFDGFLGHGLDLIRRHGGDGVPRFVAKLHGWHNKVRRRGVGKGDGLLEKAFLTLFGHEAKLQFQACYSAAWGHVIPSLVRHQGLDGPSERFLRVWHGRWLPAGGGPGGAAGPVPALHPLSGFFMKDPALLAAAGRFVGAGEAYDRVFAGGRTDDPAYAGLVRAVLTAAHLYGRAADRDAARRARPGGPPPRPAGLEDVLDQLNGYAAREGFRCPRCGAPARVTGHQAAGDVCRLDLACPAGHASSRQLTVADLAG